MPVRISISFAKILPVFLLLTVMLRGSAQQYNNEWINYGNVYYKFKVGKDSLYRIPASTLQAAGLDATPVEQFRLFRNGVEVPLFTSVSNGPLPAGGYLEFYGFANDGMADRDLYRNPASQLNTKYNLHYDTAVYFLTREATAGSLRFRDMANDPDASALPVEPYFMYNAGTYFREQINQGMYNDVLGQEIYSSSYDVGELWSSNFIRQRQSRSFMLNNLKPYAGGPDAVFFLGAVGGAIKERSLRVSLNSNILFDSAMNYFDQVNTNRSFSSSLLSSGNNTLQILHVQPPPPAGAEPYTDRFVVSHFSILYPRQFDFGAQGQFLFELPARSEGYRLDIKNFNAGGTTPVLYDLTTMERYTANTQVAGTYRFLLSGSSVARKLVLVKPGAALAVNDLAQRSFTDLTQAGNQGNYLIISNERLYTGSSGNNPVEDYRAYRSSVHGGGHDAKLFNIEELTDEFAFGIKGHPLAIRNFIRFARERFSRPPTQVLLIGKGVTYNYYRLRISTNPYTYQEQPRLRELALIPTFGWPGSDNLLATSNNLSIASAIEIGRVSAIRGTEVENYLEKVKQYEANQQSNVHTLNNKLWMKNGLQVTGSFDALVGVELCNYINKYMAQASDTLVGGKITNICKNITTGDESTGSQMIRQLFESGLSLFTYFGHSSNTTLEFNLEDPEQYKMNGRYPVFSVNGCSAGDFFKYDEKRFNQLETLSEKFNLTKLSGSIAFLASTHLGVTTYLNTYLTNFYKRMGSSDYGATLGKLTRDGLSDMSAFHQNDFLSRAHAEEVNLHGDPALRMNFEDKPDYIIEPSLIEIDPAIVSMADRQFTLKVKYYNMGRAIYDSLQVEIKRILPNGSAVTLFSGKRLAPLYADSLQFQLPIVGLTDKGQNSITVSLDGNNAIAEMEENNNSISKVFFIYEDELTPVFPYPYAIVHDPVQKLYASTANPFSNMKQYVLEVDTTALFNSPLKVSSNLSSVGGLLEFSPQISYKDSTVYYWRTATVPDQGAEYVWNRSSFFFRNTQQEGFNQSHFFQQTESTGEEMVLDTASRSWEFGQRLNNVFIRQGTYPTSSGEQNDYSISVNQGSLLGAGCVYDELIFNVLDKNSFTLWPNDFSGSTGLYESYLATCGPGREYNYEYLLNTREWRKKAMDFMDIIPDGSYVIVRNNGSPTNAANTYPAAWAADTTVFGSGNSLYHKLKNAGFAEIDSINRPRSWAFVYRKGGNKFQPVYKISIDQFDKLVFNVEAVTPNIRGAILSPEFGPAKKWHELRWAGHSLETDNSDSVGVSLVGIAANQAETVLRNFPVTETHADISDIDAVQYPYLKLVMHTRDSSHATPYQLDYWRLIYDPVPEGALAPNIYLQSKDTIELGEKLEFAVAFKNVSRVNFDSLKVKVVVTDRNNVPHELPQSLLKPLQVGDTVILRYLGDSRQFTGNNMLFIEFNPDDHQPEQFHFNNYLLKNLYVKGDQTNPLLDVTFDGIHILSGDIVSARPMIQIKLKDESKFNLLKDTSLIRVRVKFPDNSIKEYRFDNDTVRFTPAVSGSDNTATIDFSPSFLQTFNEEGDTYELIVSGKDASDNPAGRTDYSVSFVVINKPMISNLLNYPNPFTTSTAFVFTLTGSEIPTNFKIQIMTVTGKIVREITGYELGPLRIGRNITEYKWDGTDQFGQRLANGVYLYRVVTMLNGKKLDKYKSASDNTDKYFNRGYGKMYLMR